MAFGLRTTRPRTAHALWKGGFMRSSRPTNLAKTLAIACGLLACGLDVSFGSTALAQIVIENEPAGFDPLAARTAFLTEFLEANPGAGIYVDEPERGGRVSRVYGAAFSHGANPVDSAERFLARHAGVLSSDLSQLMPVGPNGDGAHVLSLGYNPADESHRFSLVGYTQHVNGIPVFRGDVRLLVRNEPGYPLVLVSNGLRDVNAFAAGFTGKAVPPSRIDVRKISRRALNQFGPGATVGEQEQVIWAGYDDAPAAEPRLAYKFVVTGTAVFDRTAKQRMLYVVDAATNQILFQEDQILHNDITATVRGNATEGVGADTCGEETPTALPYARVTVGGTSYFANAQGVVTIPNPTGATLTLTSNLTTAGQFFNVNDAAGAESSVSVNATSGSVDLLHNAANTAQDVRAEVNAYLHSNIVRDLLLAYNPTFPTIATQTGFPINVQVSGTCNAFYDGSSINFYPSGGGCNNTAFSTIVHHEFGHHIVNRAGSGQGEYGEGFSDAMGVLVTDDSRLAVGFQDCATPLRDANNTNQYSATNCSSAGSAIHTCGTLFSGCVWSTRNYLAASNPSNYRDIITNLTVDSVLLHTGTSITPAITIDFLTLDDNDADLGNGSPHYTQINAGFSEHGMPGPTLQLLEFSFPAGRPDFSNPSGGTSFPVGVAGFASTPVAGTGTLRYRVGTSGAFTAIPMTETAANQYLAVLPAAPCGAQLQYYFTAQSAAGGLGSSPLNAPASVYEATVAAGSGSSFIDTVESDLGWSLTSAGDTAITGQWVRGDPNGTSSGGQQVQPENDATPSPGVNCFYTGFSAPGAVIGLADVDGGFVTLTSPTLNGLGGNAILRYNRWYSNRIGGVTGNDVLRVQVSNDNGATWVPLETVGPGGPECAGGWFAKEFVLASVLPLTAEMKVRFIAEDINAASIVEAAIDEVRLIKLACGGSADINGDGAVDAADLAALLNGWGSSGPTDINGDGTTNAADLAALLSAWQ
jgi:deoxycytidylate deaminase